MTDSKREKMKNPILKRLYTEEELHCKIEQHVAKYKRWQSRNDYRLMAFECYDIACFFELLEDKEVVTITLKKSSIDGRLIQKKFLIICVSVP